METGGPESRSNLPVTLHFKLNKPVFKKKKASLSVLGNACASEFALGAHSFCLEDDCYLLLDLATTVYSEPRRLGVETEG